MNVEEKKLRSSQEISEDMAEVIVNGGTQEEYNKLDAELQEAISAEADQYVAKARENLAKDLLALGHRILSVIDKEEKEIAVRMLLDGMDKEKVAKYTTLELNAIEELAAQLDK